MQIFFRGMP